MGLLTKKQLSEYQETTDQRIDALNTRINDLEQIVAEIDQTVLTARMEHLEQKWKAVDAEWSMVYDKYRTLLMRLSKRDKAAEVEPEPTNGEGGRVVNPLAARLLGGQ